MKKLVFFLLAIFAVGVQAQSPKKTRMNRIEYVRTVRSQLFRASTGDSIYAPPRMGRIQYKQRTRAENVRLSESADTVKMFKGVLINSKRGLNQNATFMVRSTIVNDVPWSYSLEPGEKLDVYLPAGEYTMEIFCGNYYRKSIFHVDPRRRHYFCKEWVYFGAEKNLSDL